MLFRDEFHPDSCPDEVPCTHVKDPVYLALEKCLHSEKVGDFPVEPQVRHPRILKIISSRPDQPVIEDEEPDTVQVIRFQLRDQIRIDLEYFGSVIIQVTGREVGAHGKPDRVCLHAFRFDVYELGR